VYAEVLQDPAFFLFLVRIDEEFCLQRGVSWIPYSLSRHLSQFLR
jgi:hypothetical protein